MFSSVCCELRELLCSVGHMPYARLYVVYVLCWCVLACFESEITGLNMYLEHVVVRLCCVHDYVCIHMFMHEVQHTKIIFFGMHIDTFASHVTRDGYSNQRRFNGSRELVWR